MTVELLNQLSDDPFQQGKIAFIAGTAFRDCPYAAPLDPPRTQADIDIRATFDSAGAYWLDGWEEAEKEDKQRRAEQYETD